MWWLHRAARCFFCGNSIKWRHISPHVVIKWCPLFHSLPSSKSVPCTTLLCHLRHPVSVENYSTSRLSSSAAIQQFSYNQLHAHCTLFNQANLPFSSSVSLQLYCALPVVRSWLRFLLQNSKSKVPSPLVRICSGNATLNRSPHMWINVSNGATQSCAKSSSLTCSAAIIYLKMCKRSFDRGRALFSLQSHLYYLRIIDCFLPGKRPSTFLTSSSLWGAVWLMPEVKRL